MANAVLGNNPAFPCAVEVANDYPGLTKREYFAAMALQGLLANAAKTTDPKEFTRFSVLAVMLADDLVAALEKK